MHVLIMCFISKKLENQEEQSIWLTSWFHSPTYLQLSSPSCLSFGKGGLCLSSSFSNCEAEWQTPVLRNSGCPSFHNLLIVYDQCCCHHLDQGPSTRGTVERSDWEDVCTVGVCRQLTVSRYSVSPGTWHQHTGRHHRTVEGETSGMCVLSATVRGWWALKRRWPGFAVCPWEILLPDSLCKVLGSLRATGGTFSESLYFYLTLHWAF